ncbi:hypothetical protein EJ071_00950 [Mesorhizobium sp. M1B.F.Ca.ET.045.04.1.1]|nr:hypothetical protein EJ071_00950 [Mesorhizobium sp. M1B.F.Ca.ET.045.04.1.1]
MKFNYAGQRSFAPPSVLPDISPSRGRLEVAPAFANRQRSKSKRGAGTANLPLEGEMSGRTEGGKRQRYKAATSIPSLLLRPRA